MLKKVLIVGVIILVVAVVAARAAVLPINIGNEAISPTLKKGDVILVNRTERLLQQPLKHFDVVAIVPPYIDGTPYTPPDSLESTIADYTGLPVGTPTLTDVRRVIALPGETLVVRKDLGVFIDGKLLDESTYLAHQLQSDLFVLQDISRQAIEPGNVQPYQNSEAPIVVPPNSVFVLPDNRLDYVGSDMWGFIPLDRVVGKVEFKLGNTGIAALTTPTLHFATEKVAMNDDGVRALNKGEFTKAIQLFKSALAIDSHFELARDNLSIAYNNFAIQSVKTPDVALDSLHKALFLDPDNQLTKKNLAGVIARIGKSATNYEDRIALADDALKRGKAISALVEYREAVKLHPNPAILAKVSSLEAECNFPAHAIPEDQVKSKTLAHKTANTRSSEPGRVDSAKAKGRLQETIAQKPSAKDKAQHESTTKADAYIAADKAAKPTTIATDSSNNKKAGAAEDNHGNAEAKPPVKIAKNSESKGKEQEKAPVRSSESFRESKKALAQSTKGEDEKKPESAKSNPISMPGALASLKADLDAKKKDRSSKVANQSAGEKQKSFYDDHNSGDEKNDKKPVLADGYKNSAADVTEKTARASKKKDADSPRKIASISKEGSHEAPTKSNSATDDTASDTREDVTKSSAEPSSKPDKQSTHGPRQPNKTSKSKQENAGQPSRQKATTSDSSKLPVEEHSSSKPSKSTVQDPTAAAETVANEVRTQSDQFKNTPLRSNPLKRKADGFDFGTMVQNVFSGMNNKNSEVPPESPSYRGPPLLKKSQD